MVNWTLFLVLILPPMVCLDREVTAEETAGVQAVCTHSENEASRVETERGATSICCNNSQSLVVLIVCQIRTERGEDCSLLYREGRGFVNKCDSRFRLVTQSQTVLLQWSGLTPEDHGNITCQCSTLDRAYSLYLNVTKDDALEGNGSLSPGMIALIIVICVIFAVVLCICGAKTNGRDGPFLCLIGCDVCFSCL